MSFTDLLWPRREFQLPVFELAPFEFSPEEELLLDSVATSIGAIPAPDDRAEPSTAGELHEKVEAHLRLVEERDSAPDAAQELRNALAQLRRSIG